MSILIVSSQPETNPLLKRLVDHLDPCVYFSTSEDLAGFSLDDNVDAVSSLDDLSEPPSLIIGQSHLEMMSALTRFPQTPGIYYYADSGWAAEPPITPQIGLYLVTNVKQYNSLRYDYGIPEHRILHSFHLPDLDHLPQLALPKATPERALAIWNSGTNQPVLDIVRGACSKLQIEVDTLNSSLITPSLFDVIANYDIVFACDDLAALSLALLRVVILWHPYGGASLITPANLNVNLQSNFRVDSNYDAQISIDTLGYELAQYNVYHSDSMAAQVRQFYAEPAVVARMIERILMMQSMPFEPTAAFQSRYLQWLARSIPLQIAADEQRSAAQALKSRDQYERLLVEKHQLEQMVIRMFDLRTEDGQVQEILNVMAKSLFFWRIVARLWRVKQWLIPPDSLQFRLLRTMRTFLRKLFHGDNPSR